MVRLGSTTVAVPSVVYATAESTVLIGEEAAAWGRDDPHGLALEFKGSVGDSKPLDLGGNSFLADELIVEMVAWVHDLVTEREGGTPDSVVLTHPAWWDDQQRAMVRESLDLAGFAMVQLGAESQAAALTYAMTKRLANGAAVAVYDFGGTFNAAVLRRRGATLEILGEPTGAVDLGGRTLDKLIADWVGQEIIGRAGLGFDPMTEPESARLREACILAKNQLSTAHEVQIPVESNGFSTEVALTRDHLDQMMSPMIDQTVAQLAETIRSTGLTHDEVDAVLVVGESSASPLVETRLRGALGMPLITDIHRKHSIALGAAASAARSLVAERRSAPPTTVRPSSRPDPEVSPAVQAGPARLPSHAAPHRKREQPVEAEADPRAKRPTVDWSGRTDSTDVRRPATAAPGERTGHAPRLSPKGAAPLRPGRAVPPATPSAGSEPAAAFSRPGLTAVPGLSDSAEVKPLPKRRRPRLAPGEPLDKRPSENGSARGPGLGAARAPDRSIIELRRDSPRPSGDAPRPPLAPPRVERRGPPVRPVSLTPPAAEASGQQTASLTPLVSRRPRPAPPEPPSPGPPSSEAPSPEPPTMELVEEDDGWVDDDTNLGRWLALVMVVGLLSVLGLIYAGFQAVAGDGLFETTRTSTTLSSDSAQLPGLPAELRTFLAGPHGVNIDSWRRFSEDESTGIAAAGDDTTARCAETLETLQRSFGQADPELPTDLTRTVQNIPDEVLAGALATEIREQQASWVGCRAGDEQSASAAALRAEDARLVYDTRIAELAG